MKKTLHLVLISTLAIGAFGCTTAEPALTPEAKTVAPVVAKLVLPSGTQFKVSLIDALDSDTNSTGDSFMASLTETIVVDGKTALPKGTLIRGRVVDVEKSGKVKGLASIHLALIEITQGSKRIAITTDTYGATAAPTKARDGAIIAGGAGIGAAIGAIAGGKKGTAIGAIAGGGAGTGVVLATKGKDIHYGPETLLNFTLTNSIQL